MQTTLNKIKENNPCDTGWEMLLKFLNKTDADDEPLLIKTILESNGVKDAIWALRAVDKHEREIRLMAADFAESVLPIYEKKYPNDDRPRKAIQAARDFANGLINSEQLDTARAAAWDAAWTAWDAARAAWDAARAAWDAAMAARAAARAAWDAAMAAEIEKQKEILLKYLDN